MSGFMFDYHSYRQLLAHIQTDRTLCRFSDFAKARRKGVKVALIRHDVDLCPRRALEMAVIEQQAGVISTYMVMTQSPLYDLSDPGIRDCIGQIRVLGHEIGLHFDNETTGDPIQTGDEELARALSAGCRVLEDITGDRIESFSFHRPLPRLLRGPLLVHGLVNAYAAELMEAYISDSRGIWRCGDPVQASSNFTESVLQVLTHPIWWGHTHDSPQNHLERLVSQLGSRSQMRETRMIKVLIAETVPGVWNPKAI